MSDRARKAAKILSRVRELGGNIVWDDVGHRIFIAGYWRLPAGANKIIRDHAAEIACIVREEQKAEFEERAAIIEHDGGLTRNSAEYLARLLLAQRPAEVDPADWNWFVDRAAKIMDGTTELRSAA